MRIKNLYVGAILEKDRISTEDDNKMVLVPNKIIEDFGDNYYMDMESKCLYYCDDNDDNTNLVDKDNLIPLSEYYYKFGFKKKNNYENKTEVYNKVKKIRRMFGKL